VVLYEMLTGQRAFAGEDTADVLASVLQRDIAWALLPSTTPAHVVRLLRRCLERDRRKRLRDIGDALIELEGSSEPSVEPRTAGSRSPRWVWTAVVAAISLAAGASATRLWPSSPAPAEVLRLGVTVPDGWRVPMTAPRVGRANAADSAIAISRDGRQLAFVATKDGRSSLWVRALDGVAPRNIEGTEGASNPFWSPDGSAIAYFAAGKLRKLVLATRESIALCDVDNPRGGAWSSRGVIVFGDVTRPIQRVSENGGIPTPATRVEPGEVSHNRPAFLPDDLHFAYRSVIEGATGNEGPIHVVSLDGGEARKLIDSEIANVQFSSGRMLFVRGGTLLSQPFDADNLKLSGEPTILAEQVQLTGNPNLAQFSASRQGTLVYKTNESAASVNGLGWLELTGGGWRNVGDGGRYAHVELSNDGIRAALAIDEGRGVRRLWLFDLVRATRTRLTTNDAVEAAPAWSPDGRWLAFMEGRGAEDRLSIMVGPGDGSALPRKLLDITSNVRGLGWSADSRSLLVSARQTTTSAGSLDIMRIAIDPPGVMEPVVASRFDEAMPQVSRDGRWLAYRSNESGVEEVYVVPFGRSGPRVVISNGGGTMPRWGRDASELYYAVPESADLSARPGSIVRVRLQQVAGGIQPGVPERVANSPTVVPASAGNNAWSYAVSMDGQRLLAIVPPPGGTAPIMVLKNWESLAR
jgi:Tol biopolymer transport system component